MPQQIQVGNDILEFPDGMSDKDIAAAIELEYGSGGKVEQRVNPYNGKTYTYQDLSGTEPTPLVNPTKQDKFNDWAGDIKAKINSVDPGLSGGGWRSMKDTIDAGAQWLPRGLEFATSAGGMFKNPVSDYFGSEARRVDKMVEEDEKNYQLSRGDAKDTFDPARVVGGMFLPLGAANKAIQSYKYGKSIIAGGVGGALQPVVNGGDNFVNDKAEQIGYGAALGKVGEKVISGIGRVASPAISAAEQKMRDLGIRMTPGESLGGMYRRLEEWASNVPGLGGPVKNARDAVLHDFNKATINEKVFKYLPKDYKMESQAAGRDAVNEAATKVSKAYDDIASKMSYTYNFDSSRAILDALNKAEVSTPELRDQLTKIVQMRLLDKFQDGSKVDGATIKKIESSLRNAANSRLYSKDPDKEEIGHGLNEVLKAFKKSVYEQNPKLTPDLRRIDTAYRNLDIIQRAAANTAAERGVFTPKQLQQAVRQADETRNKRGFARGKGDMNRYADDSLEALGNFQSNNNINNVTMGNGIGMLGVGVSQVPGTIAGGIAAGRGLYSEPGLIIADKLLHQRTDEAKAFGEYLKRNKSSLGGLFSAGTLNEYNREERK